MYKILFIVVLLLTSQSYAQVLNYRPSAALGSPSYTGLGGAEYGRSWFSLL